MKGGLSGGAPQEASPHRRLPALERGQLPQGTGSIEAGDPVEGVSFTERDHKRAVACLRKSKLITELVSIDLSHVARLLRIVDIEPGVRVRRTAS
jgi:hypothetical protein